MKRFESARNNCAPSRQNFKEIYLLIAGLRYEDDMGEFLEAASSFEVALIALTRFTMCVEL